MPLLAAGHLASVTFRAVQPLPIAAETRFSSDGSWWWDGQQWVAAISPDGRHRWNGTSWKPARKMLGGDYASQSIICAVAGLFCFAAFPFGLYAGIRAYRDLPWKRTQAIVGVALNSVGCSLLVAVLLLRIYSRT